MKTLGKVNGLLTPAEGMPLLGEIVTWTCSGATVRYSDLIAALRDCRLDDSVARELAPRHAFTRACKKLAQQRIIRQVAEDATTIRFQFTAEQREGDRYSYDFETLLTLEKATGKVTCDLAGLATLAQEELDRCIQIRTGSDLTRIIQKLFERTADLFPIREQGGAYFCPQEHVDLLEKVQCFLGRLNGRMQRFPIPAGTPHGDRSVKESVAAGLKALITAHEEAVERFGDDTRPDTLERAAERIRQTRFKVEAYAAYLAEERERLDRELSMAARKLRSKVESIAAGRELAGAVG